MTDVTTYEIDHKVRRLEYRVERIEKDRLQELEQRNERMRQKTEAIMRWFTFGMVLIGAIAWTVVITLAISGR